jgi:hypothetical protein
MNMLVGVMRVRHPAKVFLVVLDWGTVDSTELRYTVLSPRTCSFPFLLYEMVTGHRPFPGDFETSTLGAIIHKEPAPLLDVTPHDLQKLVNRSLRTEVHRRWQKMADVRFDLEELKEESDSGQLVSAQIGEPAKKGKSPVWKVAAAAVLVVAAGAFLWHRFWQSPSPDDESRPGVLAAMVARRTEHRVSPRNAGEGGNDVYLAPPLGGAERTIADIGDSDGLCWLADGKWLAISERTSNHEVFSVYLLSVTSGPSVFRNH